MLTVQETELWNKIENFQFEPPDAKLKFATRLARENNWSLQFSNRVILEYKKFIFLCTISTTGCTPSDAVDQAWHLHLTYTKSYWKDLCQDILGKEIHHNPTEGGEKENTKFDKQYTSSISLYEEKFDMKQPLDVWPENEERFSDIHFQRINVSKNWIIEKPKYLTKQFLKHALVLGVLIALSTLIQSFYEGFFWFALVVIVIWILYLIFKPKNNNRNRGGGSSSSSDSNSSGCSSSSGWFIFGASAGCGSSSDSGHSSGCSSSSGCGSSGCGSSCGSGCGGGGCSS